MMKTKQCSNPECLVPIKPISEFFKNKDGKNGLSSHCKECCKDYQKENKGKIQEYKKEYQIKNKDRIQKHEKEYHKEYPWKRILRSIKNRCNNLKNKSYKNYGERGIRCLISEEELEELWFRDKAYEMEQPSIDREDNNGDYILSNCRFIELVDNIKKSFIDNPRTKIVLQYSLNGVFIREWESIINVERTLNISQGNICKVALGKAKTAGGFKWEYKDVQ